MTFRVILLICIMPLFSACVNTQVKEQNGFSLLGREALYLKKQWSFSGRMAVKDSINSLTASIQWQHQPGLEKIELSGPFGQGRTVIEVTENRVIIDDGEQVISYSGIVDEIIAQHVGVTVPISALKFWVLGVTAPEVNYLELENGFSQANWLIHYSRMQRSGENNMPGKIKIVKDNIVLKFVIQQWDL